MADRSPYRHVLLAVDLAPDSAAVGARAVEIARQSGARLSLVHVVEHVPLDLSADLVLAQPVDLDLKLIESARRQLAELAAALGVPDAQRHVEAGATKAEILRIAKEQEADLIVLGSHQRHGLALLLGSTANAVLHGAPCDLLAVRV